MFLFSSIPVYLFYLPFWSHLYYIVGTIAAIIYIDNQLDIKKYISYSLYLFKYIIVCFTGLLCLIVIFQIKEKTENISDFFKMLYDIFMRNFNKTEL